MKRDEMKEEEGQLKSFEGWMAVVRGLLKLSR